MTDTNWSEWIKWEATEDSVCPVKHGPVCQVEFGDGGISSVSSSSDYWEWSDCQGVGTIVAYRYELADPNDWKATPEEDEAFDAIGKRDVFEEIAEGFDDLSTGNFASHWVKDPSALADKQYSKYFRDVSRLDSIDVYKVHKLFTVEDHALCHASKKILLAGTRTGEKPFVQDITEARDTLTRWLEMEREL